MAEHHVFVSDIFIDSRGSFIFYRAFAVQIGADLHVDDKGPEPSVIFDARSNIIFSIGSIGIIVVIVVQTHANAVVWVDFIHCIRHHGDLYGRIRVFEIHFTISRHHASIEV